MSCFTNIKRFFQSYHHESDRKLGDDEYELIKDYVDCHDQICVVNKNVLIKKNFNSNSHTIYSVFHLIFEDVFIVKLINFDRDAAIFLFDCDYYKITYSKKSNEIINIINSNKEHDIHKSTHNHLSFDEREIIKRICMMNKNGFEN